MKKITFLRANLKAIGGAEIYLNRLIKALENENIKYELKSLKMPKFLSSWIKALVFNIYARITKKNSFYFSLERISSADIYRAGDGVHKIYMKSKKFWWLNPLNFVYPFLEKRCFNNAKMIIANSNFIKNQIIQAYKIPENKIKVIYNGINLQENFNKEPYKNQICDELRLDKSLPIILFVGSGFKRKGMSELLEILSKINHDHNAIIIGKDKKQSFYEQKAIELGLKNVKFLGAKRGIDDYYKAADIFIFPTHYEPFSNVILEALSFKNVAITTTQNGASEVIDPKFVMSSPDDKSILQTLQILLTKPEILKTEQENAYEISKKYGIEKNAKETLEAIKSVIR